MLLVVLSLSSCYDRDVLDDKGLNYFMPTPENVQYIQDNATTVTLTWSIPSVIPEDFRRPISVQIQIVENNIYRDRITLVNEETSHTFTIDPWRISGDTQWMKDLFPAVKKSLDYCIRTWDPLHKGYLEEPHHNTYDIEFWGPDGMCTSFYLGALTAFIEMGKELKQPVKEYTALLSKGKKYMETALFDGEYFIQKIQWEGLQAPNPVDVMSFGGSYSDEALKLLKEEGPKYQYGTGCLSDGILGMWMASVCGLDEVLDNEKVRSHLVAVHKYNLKHDLVDHFNPQRPVYACGKDGGLLLCTWPKGGMLSLPFVYSNEVWTGIEYQVASHLMMKGEVEKGLDIVRECRERYDGRVRNPFNEIECGHWYARAMASYGMLQGLTGVRYDAVDKTMYINSKIGDFKSFISTDTGFGTIEWKAGKPVLNVVYGNIDVKRYNVSGKIVD